jgi:hypothetical protein
VELAFRIRLDEKRYIKDEGPTQPPVKGKVLVENVSVSLRNGAMVLFRKTYRGNKSRKAEAFNNDAPVQGGYLVKLNGAEIDYVEIAEALLDDPPKNLDLSVALGSKDKYIHAAAVVLSDSWRGTSAPRIEPERGEGIDDD